MAREHFERKFDWCFDRCIPQVQLNEQQIKIRETGIEKNNKPSDALAPSVSPISWVTQEQSLSIESFVILFLFRCLRFQ